MDIDLDFTLACTRNEMLEKRKGIKDLIERFMQDEGYGLSDRSRYAHTLDSYVFSYNTLSGSRDVLKIEINYSDRYHVLDPVETETSLVLKRDLRVRRLHKGEKVDIPKMSQCVTQELKQLFKLTDREKEFITSFNDGVYRPQLLFDGLNVNDMSAHPMALWKVQK